MKILFVGPLSEGSTTIQRCRTMKDLGYKVFEVNTINPKLTFFKKILNKLFYLNNVHYDWNNVNLKILDFVKKQNFDYIWIEKGLKIKPSTLRKIIKKQKSKLISYSCDDMMIKQNQSSSYLKCIPIYDCHVTNKSYNVNELKNLGAKEVFYFINFYDKIDYSPKKLNDDDIRKWSSEIAFLGGYEKDRLDRMLYLANRGLKIKIWGPSWEGKENVHKNLDIVNGWVMAKDASKVFMSTKINLHFLRKLARDLQTTRTMEIPGSGGFMLAERTSEHIELFEEGVECEFFETNEELYSKIIYYLNNENKRKSIAMKGLKRCKKSGYDYHNGLKEIFKII